MSKRLIIHNGSISIGGQEKMLVEFLKTLNPKKYDVLLLIEQNLGKEKSYLNEIPKWINYSFLTSEGLSIELEKNKISKNPLRKIWYSFLLKEKKRKATNELKKYLTFSDIIIDYNMGLLRNLHKLNLKDKTVIGWSHAGNGTPPKNKQKRKNQEKYNYIVTVNEKMKKGYEKNTANPKILKINNFMEFEKIVKESKKDTIEKFKYILNVGSLTGNKNQNLLIEAFYKLKLEKSIEEKLLIVGDGKKRKELEEKIKALNMESEIFLLGEKLNPYRYIKRAEILIITSMEESFSLVTLEAMALGTMVIATQTDGTRELLGEDSKYGKLISNNVDELQKELGYYLENIEERKKYQELGIERAKCFSKEKVKEKIEEFIDKL